MWSSQLFIIDRLISLYYTLCCLEPLQAVTKLALFQDPIPNFLMLHTTYMYFERQDEAIAKLDGT